MDSFHGVFLYIFIGYLLIFPLVMGLIKLFRVNSPKHRTGLYVLSMLLPLIGPVAVYLIAGKRCQAGFYPSGSLQQVYNFLCLAGGAILPILPLIFMGALAFSLLKVVAGSVFVARLRRVGGSEQRVHQILEHRCNQLSLRLPRVIICNKPNIAAVTVGLIRPSIVLSSCLLELSDQELDMVLTHELVHIKRGDTRVGWLLDFVRGFAFFSPFSTALYNNYLVERERLCDLHTVKVVGNKGLYAKTLLRVWKSLLDNTTPVMAVNFLGDAGAMEYRFSKLVHKDSEGAPYRFWISSLFLAGITLAVLWVIC